MPTVGTNDPLCAMTLCTQRTNSYAVAKCSIKLNLSILSLLDENKQWFLDLKVLVEETFEANGKIPVTFIVHSMGAPMSLVFLQQQDNSWKSKYISKVISLAGAWAGSVKAVKVFAIGLIRLI